MEWLDFLRSILDEKQIGVLRNALKLKANVYFYGGGLGKSTIANVLKDLGFEVSEPGMVPCGYSTYVPDRTNYICFNVKKKMPKKLIPNLEEQLKAQKEEIIAWVEI